MSQARLGVQEFIAEYIVKKHPDAVERSMRELEALIGRELARELVSRACPVVVRTNFDSEFQHDAYGHSMLRISLICDLRNVETMQYREMKLPPFEFTRTDNKVIEWQCGYCGSVNIVADHLDCRKCGAPRLPMR